MLFKRFLPFTFKRAQQDAAQKTDWDGRIDMRASSDEPVAMGSWREVLSHDDGAMDASSARSLLANHDPDQLIGSLDGDISSDGRCSSARASIMADARLKSGVRVRDAVASGALAGVSIGYHYNMDDTEWDEDTRTLRVNRWSIREISLTPIPADVSASVRSLPEGIQKRNIPMSDTPEQIEAKRLAQVASDAALKAREQTKQIVRMATSLKLDPDAYMDLELSVAQGRMIEAVAARDKTVLEDPKGPVTPVVEVTLDNVDRQRDAFTDAMIVDIHQSRKTGVKVDGNPYLGLSMMDKGREYAIACGVRGAERWRNKDIAHFILGEHHQIGGKRDAANIVVANFPNFVTLNAITKIVAKGYEMAESSVTYGRISETQRVPDFKSFYIGGLGTGNLQQVAENAPFPELIKAEGVYNDTAKMWGGTLSLTLQALINDDTALFDRSLRMSGAIARKTIDKRVYQKLMMGTSAATGTSTWTSNTTAGCSPVWTTADTLAAARAKVNTGIAALMNKVGLDGNPGGAMAKYILGGPTVGIYLKGLFGSAPGQTVSNSYAGDQELIISQWFEASSLTGNSTTSFYALADPADITSLVVSLINGYESPQVQEFDAGAVGARKWKIWQPFEADLFYAAVTGTNTIFGAQQCTT